MDMIADILLISGALGVAFYCFVLSRRLTRFTDLERGVGGAVAVLSAQVDDLNKALDRTRAAAEISGDTLRDLTAKADGVARRLELHVAAMHDFPATPQQPAAAPPPAQPAARPEAAYVAPVAAPETKPAFAPEAEPAPQADATPVFTSSLFARPAQAAAAEPVPTAEAPRAEQAAPPRKAAGMSAVPSFFASRSPVVEAAE